MITMHLRYLFLLIILLEHLAPTFLHAMYEQPHHTTAYLPLPRALDLLPSFSYYSTKHFWNEENKKLPSYNHFKKKEYSLYAEYGLNARFSLTLNSGFSTVTESLNGNSRGFQDIELGFKNMIIKKNASGLTYQILALIP